MSEIHNLWPQDILKQANESQPVTILRQQAKYLEEMTDGILVGTVKSYKNTNRSEVDTNSGLVHKLIVNAPYVSYYFTLVEIIQEDIVDPYPVHMSSPLVENIGGLDDIGLFQNVKEVEDGLKQIFKSKKVVEVLQSLITQSDKPKKVIIP